jgi:hypothetical protein
MYETKLNLPQCRATSDTGCQTQLLAAYVFLVAHPVFQIPTNKPVPCPWLIVVGEAIKEVCVLRLSPVALPLTFLQMIYRKDLINDVAACQLFATYPLTASAMQVEWVKWAEYESRKRLGPMAGIYIIMRF